VQVNQIGRQLPQAAGISGCQRSRQRPSELPYRDFAAIRPLALSRPADASPRDQYVGYCIWHVSAQVIDVALDSSGDLRVNVFVDVKDAWPDDGHARHGPVWPLR